MKGPSGDGYARGMYYNYDRFNYICSQIATGDPEWLRLAAFLWQYSDADYSEDLAESLSSALIVEPSNVLRAVKQAPEGTHKLPAWAPCLGPFDASIVELKEYGEKATRMVSAITDPQLRQERDECLSQLSKIGRYQGPTSPIGNSVTRARAASIVANAPSAS